MTKYVDISLKLKLLKFKKLNINFRGGIKFWELF